MQQLKKNIDFLLKKEASSFAQLKKKLQLSAGSIQSLRDISDCQKISRHFNISLDQLVNNNLNRGYTAKKNIRLLVCDIDGVLTDGGMYYTEAGDEFKKFNTKDGIGIKRLIKQGTEVAFLSNGINKNLIQRRAKLLGVKLVYVGLDNKITVMNQWIKQLGTDWKHIAYIADDINDLGAIEQCALTACPRDASEGIKTAVHIILSKNGGEGCVREFIDDYLL